MNGSFGKDIKLAILIAVVASVIGLIVNTVRTPVLDGLVKSGKAHVTTRNKYMGLRPVDDWSHKGDLKQVKSGEENEGVEGRNGEEPIVITTPTEPVLRQIDFLEAERVYESGEAVFLDARISSEYEMGHIAGAKSWPQNRFLEYLDIYEEEIPYDTHLVVYCEGGQCEQSQRLLEDLSFTGYLVIDLYYGGYEDWLNMEMPFETGAGQ